jgi:hypothetical protein
MDSDMLSLSECTLNTFLLLSLDGVYHIMGQTLVFPVDLSPYHNCFHITMIFKFVAAKILPQLSIKIIIVLCQMKAAYAWFEGASVTKLHGMQTYFLSNPCTPNYTIILAYFC